MPDDSGVLDIILPKLENSKERKAMSADMANDQTEIILEEGGRSHNLLLVESAANVSHVSNYARSSGVKKFDEVDPIESAAVEQIFRR